MSKVVEVKLSSDMKKDLTLRLLTAINDEVESLNSILSGYSSDEYFQTAAEGVKETTICNRVTQIMQETGLYGATILLLFRRRSAAAANLGHTYVMTTIRSTINESTIEHSLGTLNIPYDQFDTQGLFTVEEGVYAMGMISEGPFQVVDDEEHSESKENNVETLVEETKEDITSEEKSQQ